MDRAEKIFSILLTVFGVMLALCLFLSIASVVMLSKSRERAALVAAQNEERMEEIFSRLENIEQSDLQTDATDDESVETNADALGSDGFLIRELDGKIGVYKKDGALLKKVDIPIKILPKKEQQAVKNGIEVDSIDELLKMMQDIGS